MMPQATAVDWSTVTYADLTDAAMRKVEAARAHVLERWAEDLRENPDDASEIVDWLIHMEYLADHMAGLRWVASVLPGEPHT